MSSGTNSDKDGWCVSVCEIGAISDGCAAATTAGPPLPSKHAYHRHERRSRRGLLHQRKCSGGADFALLSPVVNTPSPIPLQYCS